MAFSKFLDFFSSASTRLSAPKAFAYTYKPTGLPPTPSVVHGYVDSISEKRTNLRPAASLQDFSTYHQLDPEDDRNPAIERSSSHTFLPSSVLQQESFASSFSKEKGLTISSRRNKWLRVLCVLLCLLFLACVCFGLLILYFNWFRGSSQFYVVIDCGSTGSRVYVYEASVNQEKDDNLPILLKSLPENFERKSGSKRGRAYNRMETEPGLDKLVNNAAGLKKAMKPLIRWAEKQIPKESHKSTSLFLYATAGVRRLPSSDSDWLLDNSWYILKSSPFLCKKEWVKIITGMEEAYYGWIALNYHTGVLGSIPRKETYGALDLGGSSLQITFEGAPKDQETSLKLSIGPIKHHLNAYSLAGYGLNDAFDKSVAHLARTLPNIRNADLVGGKLKIKHPCLHTGYKASYLCTLCESILVKDGSPSEAKTSGKGKKPGIPVQLIGSPNWDECSALAKVVINLSEWSDGSPKIDCELEPCALAKSLPRPVGQFYAMSGFYVVYRFFNLTPDAALDDVLEKGHEFCQKTWSVARKSVAPQPFIEQYCFRAPYVVLLLREGLHITDRRVTTGSGSITWTLGVALFEAGKAFPYGRSVYNYPILRAKIDPFIVFAILFASIFILLCAFSCTGNWWIPKFFRSYLPFFKHNSATSTSVLNIPAPFRFQRWSPISPGDGRVKMPLSPTVSNAPHRPFGTGLGFGGGSVQFTDSSLYSSSSSVPHSYSSGSLAQMQCGQNNLGSIWTPHRSKMHLQSRRSQSREDLSSSITDLHLTK